MIFPSKEKHVSENRKDGPKQESRPSLLFIVIALLVRDPPCVNIDAKPYKRINHSFVIFLV